MNVLLSIVDPAGHQTQAPSAVPYGQWVVPGDTLLFGERRVQIMRRVWIQGDTDARLILVGMDVDPGTGKPAPEPGEEWKAEDNTHSLS